MSLNVMNTINLPCLLILKNSQGVDDAFLDSLMHSHPNNAPVKTMRTKRENTVMQNSPAPVHTNGFFKTISRNSNATLADSIVLPRLICAATIQHVINCQIVAAAMNKKGG